VIKNKDKPHNALRVTGHAPRYATRGRFR